MLGTSSRKATALSTRRCFVCLGKCPMPRGPRALVSAAGRRGRAAIGALNRDTSRARARERLIIVEFRGFRRARSPQEMFRECSDSAHRLHSKKPLPWRVTGASVARHVERPRVRSKNVYIAEPAPELQPMCCEIGAPRREIGVELGAERSAWSWAPRDRRGVGRREIGVEL